MLDRLEVLRRDGALEDLDLHFARLISRVGDGEDSVALAAALVSQWTGRGHICLDLASVAGTLVGEELGEGGIEAPPLDLWVWRAGRGRVTEALGNSRAAMRRRKARGARTARSWPSCAGSAWSSAPAARPSAACCRRSNPASGSNLTGVRLPPSIRPWPPAWTAKTTMCM